MTNAAAHDTVRYALIIRKAEVLCIANKVFGLPFFFSKSAHTSHPYRRMELFVFISNFRLDGIGPPVFVISLLRDLVFTAALVLALSICGPQVSFEFSLTPRYLIDICVRVVVPVNLNSISSGICFLVTSNSSVCGEASCKPRESIHSFIACWNHCDYVIRISYKKCVVRHFCAKDIVIADILQFRS